MECFRQALILKPDFAEVHNTIGMMQVQIPEGAKKDLFKAFDLYHVQGNMIYCIFTRSLIMNLFRNYEEYKDLFEFESKMASQKK